MGKRRILRALTPLFLGAQMYQVVFGNLNFSREIFFDNPGFAVILTSLFGKTVPNTTPELTVELKYLTQSFTFCHNSFLDINISINKILVAH
jgi:Mn-containing catalase